MTLTVLQPAPLDSAMALIFARQPATRRRYAAAVLQLCEHESYGFADAEGRLVCAFGFWPLGADEGGELVEMWLAIAPQAVPHLPRLARLSRLILARLTQSGGVTVRALVRAGHRPGGRLAALAGLRHARTLHGVEHWESGGQADG